jgi:hypothetical protein
MTWTESAGQLLGSLQTVTATPTELDAGIKAVNSVIRGVFLGNNYQFTIESSPVFFGATAISGVVTKDILTLTIPSNKGGFTSTKLTKTTLEKFSTSLKDFEAKMEKRSQELRSIAKEKVRKAAEEEQKAFEAQKKLSDFQLILTKRSGAEELLEDLSSFPVEIADNLKIVKDNITMRQQTIGTLSLLSSKNDCYEFNVAKVGIYEIEAADNAKGILERIVNETREKFELLDGNLKNYKDDHRLYVYTYKQDTGLPPINVLDAKTTRVKSEVAKQLNNIDSALKKYNLDSASLISKGESMTCVVTSP